jgi:hypothetical protein
MGVKLQQLQQHSDILSELLISTPECISAVTAPSIEVQCNIYDVFSLSLSFWRVLCMRIIN